MIHSPVDLLAWGGAAALVIVFLFVAALIAVVCVREIRKPGSSSTPKINSSAGVPPVRITGGRRKR